MLVRSLGGESEARRVVGDVHWRQVRSGDGWQVTFSPPPSPGIEGCTHFSSLNAEWVMYKRDGKEVNRAAVSGIVSKAQRCDDLWFTMASMK